jgi:hypothetical protein
MSEKKETMSLRGGISRREFARRAVVASAVAVTLPGGVVADKNPPAKTAGGAPEEKASRPTNRDVSYRAASDTAGTGAQQPANTPKLSAEGQAEAEARFQSIMTQYGKRFSEEQKADLRRLCYVGQPALDRLRAYALANGDAPALYLKPLVEREKNPLENTRKGKTPTAVNAKKSSPGTTHAH